MKKSIIAVSVLLIILSSAELYPQERIKFKKGSSYAKIEYGFARGESKEYILKVNANQTCVFSIASVEANAVFDVINPYNEQIFAQEVTSWKGTAERDGDIKIFVGSTRGGTEYTLYVTVYP